MASTKNRKVYKPEFKAKVALEAVRGKLTINQIAKQFEVHPVSDFQLEKAVSRIFAADL